MFNIITLCFTLLLTFDDISSKLDTWRPICIFGTLDKCCDLGSLVSFVNLVKYSPPFPSPKKCFKLICEFLVQTEKLPLTFSFWQWQKKGEEEGDRETSKRYQEGRRRRMGEEIWVTLLLQPAVTFHWSVTRIRIPDWLLKLLSPLILTMPLPSSASNPRKGAILGIWQPKWFWDFRLFRLALFPFLKCLWLLLIYRQKMFVLGQKVRLNWKLSLLSQGIWICKM